MKQPGIKYGIIAGVGTISYTLIFYFINKSMMVSPWINWSSIVIYIFAMLMAMRTKKLQSNGRLDLRTAIRTGFQTFLIANAFNHLFFYAMYNFVDPSLLDLAKEAMLDSLKWLYTEEQLQELAQTPFQVNIQDILFAYAKGAIGGFILAFILGATQRNA